MSTMHSGARMVSTRQKRGNKRFSFVGHRQGDFGDEFAYYAVLEALIVRLCDRSRYFKIITACSGLGVM